MKEKYLYTLSLFRILILFVFVLMSGLLILYGAQVYQDISQSMDDNAVLRTASGYLTNKEREYGTRFSLEEGMLMFESIIEEEHYYSRVYYMDGKMMESFLPKGYEFEFGGGEEIVSLDSMDIRQVDQQVEVVFREGSNSITKILAVTS